MNRLLGQALEEIFPGNSEMARQMRAHDWNATPLGDPLGWPDGLKIPLRMLLTSRFEMWLGWGDDLLFFYNDAYVPTLGIKHPGALAQPFRQVWAEVYDEVADQVDRVSTGESTWNSALQLLLERSGQPEETYHSFSYSPLFTTDGNVGGMLCVVSEETERVIGERRLETLRQLGMSLVGANDRAGVCRSVCEMFAANRSDFPFALLALNEGEEPTFVECSEEAPWLKDMSWPTTGADAMPHRFKLSANATWPTGDWTVPPREALALSIPGPGSHPPFGTLILALNPYRSDNAEVADFARLMVGQISGALSNVTALHTERRRADRIWSHNRDLMVVVDADGIFRAVSPSWTRLLGHPVDEVVGRPFADFIVQDDLDPSKRALAIALGDGELTGYENRFVTRDGGERLISWHTAMEDGLVYAYGRDITEQQAAADALIATQDALRQSQKMEAVGQLTGGIAHDFNNLLQGITGSLDMMHSRLAKGQTADLDRWLTGAKTSAERAAALTHRLLAFSRRQPLDPRPVRVNPLVCSMEDMLARTLGETIQLDLELKQDLWVTRCDPNQLESAILNLVINARDAMPDGGRLTVVTSNAHLDEGTDVPDLAAAAGDYICVTVRDTGVGMDKDTRERAFEPFFTTKPIGQGTGLGLSMIYGFVRQSEGYVRIQSQEGHGTAVVLLLPRDEIVDADGDPPLQNAEQDESGAGEIVLVVEDEHIVRGLVVELLQELGYRTLEAVDGPSGLKILQSDQRIDLLVTDIGLPGLNGREVADAARLARPDLRILFMTGYAENAALASGFLERGMEMITKPFTMDAFAKRVRSAFEAGRVEPV